ncbi:MAG: DUF4573 domain-containing protein [Cyanobacteria bacterium SZAS-4]|nr:DUF4573 domain-containing protein [Cyanobacteria bacterium SZAS-4]
MSVSHHKFIFFCRITLLLIAAVSAINPAFSQTVIPAPGATLGTDSGDAVLAPPARRTESTVPTAPYVDAIGQTSLITQSAEQNKQSVISNVNNQLLQGSELGAYNETYMGLKNFWSDDIVSNLFQNIGQLIGRWITELINGWVSDTVQFLTAFLRIFVLNPNIAVNGSRNIVGAANGGSDDISPFIRQAADVMYSIAVDLSLLLFIVCIWRYWIDAAWRGGVNIMAAVGRLIFTSGLLLAWPTIYAFEIQITNEMIKAVFFSSADQVAMLDGAMAATVKGGLVAGAGLLASTFAPVVGSLAGGAVLGGVGGMVLGTVGEVVAFAGLIIYLFLGVILITQLLYILVLKAIQTALLTAQYMFGPVFLVFFATPSTESLATGYVKSFVEVSLWTFCWVGLLKIMVILLFSDFNPWGKIVMGIGVLQLMISVPDFMSRARISPMSSFISAGMISGGLMNGMKALGEMAKSRTAQAIDYQTNQQFAARGLEQSNKVGLEGLSSSVMSPTMLQSLKDARKPAGKDNPPSPPNSADLNGGSPTDPNSPQGTLGPDGKPLVPPSKGAGDPNVKPATKADDALAKQGSAQQGATLNLVQQTDPSAGAGKPDLLAGAGKADPLTGAGKTDLLAGAGKADPLTGAGKTDPLTGAGKIDPLTGATKTDPAGTGKPGVTTPPESDVANANTFTGAGASSSNTGDTVTPSNDSATNRGIVGSAASNADTADLTPPLRQSSPAKADNDSTNFTPGRFASQGAAQVPSAPRKLVPSQPSVRNGNVDPSATNSGVDNTAPKVDPAFTSQNLQSAPGVEETAELPQHASPFTAFKSDGYGQVPVRTYAASIRTAERTMNSHDGPRALIGDTKGNLQHARFNTNDTDDQKAQLLAVGGYAQKYSTDPVAFDAARESAIEAGADAPHGLFENMAAGFLGHNGKSFKQTVLAKQRFQKALLEQAVVGSQAYVGMDKENANPYTNYLNATYGEMTPDRQAHMVYLLEEDRDSDSGWNPNRSAAVDLLNRTGLNITGSRLAASSVEGVKALSPWMKAAGVLSVTALLEQKANSHFADQPDVHDLVRGAYIGQMASAITPSEVSSSVALMLEAPNSTIGAQMAGNEYLVKVVSDLVSNGYQRDHTSAVKSLGEITQQLRASSTPPSGGSGSGSRVTIVQAQSAAPPSQNFAPIQSTVQSASVGLTANYEVDTADSQPFLPNLTLNDLPIEPEFTDLAYTQSPDQSGEITVNQRASMSISNSSNQAASRSLASSTQDQIFHAQQIIMQAHDAGFDDRQLRVPSVARAIVAVHARPELMRPAAMAAAVLMPEELTPEMIETADAMVGANWNQVTREDLIAGKSILQQNGYPDRQAVQIVRQDPGYTPALFQGQDGGWQATPVPASAVQQVNLKRAQANNAVNFQSAGGSNDQSLIPPTPPPPLTPAGG